MDTIKLNLNLIEKSNLNVQEYLTLYYIYHQKQKEYTEFAKIFGPLSSMFIKSLESKKFIKICVAAGNAKCVDEIFELREKARNLFEGEKDHFIEWFGKFPIKTPTGRYLSTADPDTIMGKDLRKKWNKIFKNDANSARKAIEVLEAETKWRRNSNKLEYMHNAKTWLNQGDFENFAHLLDDKRTDLNKMIEDFT